MKLFCEILGRNNSHKYPIATGAVFTENYNETLDTGTIILPQVDNEIAIEPYDIVVITETNDEETSSSEIRRMCVDKVVRTITCLNPVIYKYEITLFSETKLLEGVLLPSLAITPLLVGDRRSVLDYLQRYLDEYSPKLNSSLTQGAYNNKFTLDISVRNKFENVQCPEMQWNEPTLREVFTDLMMIKDCIPIVKNNVIYYMDLSLTGDEITDAQKSGVNYIQTTHSSADYVSEIKMTMKNGISTGSVTKIAENINIRNYEANILTSENGKVETTYPIYKLLKMSYDLPYAAQAVIKNRNDEVIDTINIYDVVEVKLFGNFYSNQDCVQEYTEWATKPIDYNDLSPTPTINFQNTSLYYKRGSRGIFNLSALTTDLNWIFPDIQISLLAMFSTIKNNDYHYRWLWYRVSQAAWQYVVTHYPSYAQYASYSTVTPLNDSNKVNYKYVEFKLEYETLHEHTAFVSKGNTPRNQRQIVDNQSNPYVNVSRQGMLEYFKANRLGNKVSIVNARYERSDFATESTLPKLADKVNGQIIFSKEISYFSEHFNVNYYATENYVLRDYFTGIQARKRSWRILSGDEAFLRSDVMKFYMNNDIEVPDNENYLIPKYGNLQSYIDNFNYCVVQFDLGGGGYKPNSIEHRYGDIDSHIDGYLMEMQKSIFGNSVVFSIKALDNAIVGKYVSNQNFEYESGAYAMIQQNAMYVDANGENIGGYIYFYRDIYKGSDWTHTASASYPDNLSACLRPGVSRSGTMRELVAKIPFKFKKDNREITQITIQIEWNEEANDIFRGKV